jgi:pimeloyl-ACP methyl ester carboxylesterase
MGSKKSKHSTSRLLPFFGIIFILFCFVSCMKNNDTVEQTKMFSVTNKNETMPVSLFGNYSSNYIILAVHGGPGSDVLDFRNYKDGLGFKQIEQSHLVAYWQQRASGQSTGPSDTSYYNITQYVEDCDKVIDELKTRFPNKKIVLFGHSWGGMLTSSYLKDANKRAKVVAWINAAGAHNGTTLLQSTIDDINAEADKRILANEKVSYWTGVKNGLLTDPNIANFTAYDILDSIPEVLVKVSILDFNLTDRAESSNEVLFREIIRTNNSSFLQSVTIPTLFLWGKYDFAVSNKLRIEAMSNIGSSKKVFNEFTASGHYMMFHEPYIFAKNIVDFVNSL